MYFSHYLKQSFRTYIWRCNIQLRHSGRFISSPFRLVRYHSLQLQRLFVVCMQVSL